MKTRIIISLVLPALFLLAGQALGQNKSNSEKLKDLPPGHRLKSSFNGLPVQAKAKAENWLNSFTFPDEDFSSIHLDNEGGVFYVEPVLDNADGSLT